jgi:hypothetical protein
MAVEVFDGKQRKAASVSVTISAATAMLSVVTQGAAMLMAITLRTGNSKHTWIKDFFWKNFKPLEQVLWHNAAEYYRLSLSCFHADTCL